MCLIIDKGQRYKYAKEDIVCYKVVRQEDNLNPVTEKFERHYETPYQRKYVHFNTTYDESERGMDIEKGNDTMLDCDGKLYRSIYGGAFHSFKKYSDAVNEVKDWGVYDSSTTKVRQIIVKCIIPKGAKYYEGTIGMYSPAISGFPEGYASNKIIYTDTIYDKWEKCYGELGGVEEMWNEVIN